MNFEELEKRALKVFGRRWRVLLAQELGKHISAIYRWEESPSGVPRYVDMWFDLYEQRKKIERLAKSFSK